jgi:cobalt-zinc-cadmium efflux system membrane fusion protein
MKYFLLILITLALLAGCGDGAKKVGDTAESGHQHEGEKGHGAEEKGDDGHGHEEEGHGEEGHEDEKPEGFVTLTEAQRKEIGLEVAPVAMSSNVQGGTRTGRVEANPDRKVLVSPQVAGTIKHLPVIVGSRVRQGDTIAVLDSPEITVLKAEYHNAQVEVDLATKELANTRQLVAFSDESRREVEEANLELARAQASRDGAAARLESAKLTYDRLHKLRVEGIASSQQVEEALAERKALEADVREATSSVKIAEQHLQREKRVSGSQLRQKAETFPAEANLARAKENVKHAEERLLQLGASPGDNEGSVTLTSPIDGQVVERPVTRGERVTDQSAIAVLVDPSEVWVWIDLVRSDLATVDIGDAVTIRLVSDPNAKVTGEISHIDTQVDAQTQTVRALISLREPGGKFRVGSFVSATIGSAGADLPAIPQAAVQDVEGANVVYKVDGQGYRRTPVKIVAQNADTVSVSGLEPGSQIVVKGATDLKAIDLAGTIGGHSH